jgi:aminopeptidase YwaD
MQKQYLFLFAILLSFLGSAQVRQDSYARYLVDELTSDKYAGRGYVDNGMQKSAEFIAKEFQNLGLKPLNGSYFQEFSMSINVLKDANLKINGKELQYGIDFLVDPSSSSQRFQKKDYYFFDPQSYENSVKYESSFIDFIRKDMELQNGKHVVFPPHKFEVDSLNQYYKHWPNFYSLEENKDRAIFYFSSDKLTASLSQNQKQISRFYIKDSYYSKNLNIDDYLIDTEYIENFKAFNVVGIIEGENKDSLIVITSHYDHLGKVGNTLFPGANDNASGTAFMLNLAKYYSENQPKYNMVFIGFGAEEAGLLGSQYFVENPLVDLTKIKFLLNFDIMGAGEEGIQIVNSSIFTKEYDKLLEINSKNNLVKEIKKRGESCNSDHCPFYQKGVPSFFTYTLGGKGHYHDPFDTGDSIDLVKFDAIQKLFIEFIHSL